MTVLIDSVLMLAGLLIWIRGSSENDDVWSLFLRVFAVVDLAVVLLGNGQLLLRGESDSLATCELRRNVSVAV